MRDLLRQPSFVVGFVLLALVAAAVLLGPWLAPYDPQAFHPAARLQPPSAAFLLGTDQFGRDLLSRLLTGARPTVLFGLGATVLGVAAGGLIGVAAGVSAGAIDAVIMRILDGLVAVPDLLFALLIVTILGNGMGNALLAVAIAFTPGLARISRSTVLSLRGRDYVLAAVARGEGRAWIILCEVLPNAIGPVIIEATIRVAFAVMIGATLGFLGLGAQPPSTEWGLMIASARQYMARNIWTVLVPSVAIAMVALGFNLVGDALRDRLDPRARR
jgi:peptide/nickel transport system permease protein